MGIALVLSGCASTIQTGAGDTIKVGFGNRIDWHGYRIEPADNVTTAAYLLGREALTVAPDVAARVAERIAERGVKE